MHTGKYFYTPRQQCRQICREQIWTEHKVFLSNEVKCRVWKRSIKPKCEGYIPITNRISGFQDFGVGTNRPKQFGNSARRQGASNRSVYKHTWGLGATKPTTPKTKMRRVYLYGTDIKEELLKKNFRPDSSVGRAEDWKSLCRQFDSVSGHH